MIDMASLVKQYPQELSGFKRNILAEYLQCRVLAAIYGSEYSRSLVFMGGTAIRLCYENRRFSEDLDFDNRGLRKKDFISVSEKAASILALEGYASECDFSFKAAFRCFIRFPGLYHRHGLSGHEGEKLLLQIDAEPQGVDYETRTAVINRAGVFARVAVPAPAVLLSMKITALLGRKREKGRDFYDVTYLSGITAPDYGYLSQKAGIRNGTELKEALIKKISRLNIKALAADVSPFLFSRPDEQRVVHFGEFVSEMKV
jgi:predicted nucleotidyltransferase component of viral defense system